MNRIRKNWKNKPERKYCIVTKQNGRYLLYIKTRGATDFKEKEYKTATGALKYLQRNGFSPHPPPSQPKEVYLEKLRKRTFEFGRIWLNSIKHLLKNKIIASELGISTNEYLDWLENGILPKKGINYDQYLKMRNLITNRKS